jgi:hypothetical protein
VLLQSIILCYTTIPTSDTASCSLRLSNLFLGRLLVHRRGIIRRKLSILLLLAALLGLFDILLIKSDRLVALTTDLRNRDSDKTSDKHTNQICKSTGEDTDEDRHEDGEKGAANEHGEAVMAMTVVGHVVGSVVRVVGLHARAEAVRRLAHNALMLHRVAGTRLVAAGPAHLLHLLDAVSHDALPLAEERPFVALLLLVCRRSLGRLSLVKRCDHETALCSLEHVDVERGRVDSGALDRCEFESHRQQLSACLGYRFRAIVAEFIAGHTQTQAFFGGRIDLGYVEWLIRDAERGRV